MKSWKTTLIGAALAGLAFLSIYQANGGDLAHWQQWVIPFCIAALGYVAKDRDVTGGGGRVPLVLAALLLLPACQNGKFLGLGKDDWVTVGTLTLNDTLRTVPGTALRNYSEATVRAAAKQPVEVRP